MAVNCLQRAANWRQIAIIVRPVSAATKTGKERRLQGYYTALDVTYPFNGASRRTPPKCIWHWMDSSHSNCVTSWDKYWDYRPWAVDDQW